jgi:hypothetical protein
MNLDHGLTFEAAYLSKLFFPQNMHSWLRPLRHTVGDAPDHKPRRPSSFTMVIAPWIGPCRKQPMAPVNVGNGNILIRA